MTHIDLMAAPPRATDQRDPLATRRPVGTFVALIVLASVALVALGVSGAVAARLDSPGWAESAPAPGQRVWTVEIRNAGALPVQVEAATWPVQGLDHVELLLGRPGRPGPAAGGTQADAVPFAPFTLDGGETRLVALRGDLRCPPGIPGALAAPVQVERLTLRVRSPVGRRQSIDLGPGPFGTGPGAPGSGPGRPLVEPCP